MSDHKQKSSVWASQSEERETPDPVLPWRDPTVTYTVLSPHQVWALWKTPAPPSPSQPAEPRDTSTVDGCDLPRCTEEATGGWAVEPGSLLPQWMVNTHWKWDRASRTTRTAGGNTALQQGFCQQNAHHCSWGMADKNECYKQSFQNVPRVGNLSCSLLCNAYTTTHYHS